MGQLGRYSGFDTHDTDTLACCFKGQHQRIACMYVRYPSSFDKMKLMDSIVLFCLLKDLVVFSGFTLLTELHIFKQLFITQLYLLYRSDVISFCFTSV